MNQFRIHEFRIVCFLCRHRYDDAYRDLRSRLNYYGRHWDLRNRPRGWATTVSGEDGWLGGGVRDGEMYLVASLVLDAAGDLGRLARGDRIDNRADDRPRHPGEEQPAPAREFFSMSAGLLHVPLINEARRPVAV